MSWTDNHRVGCMYMPQKLYVGQQSSLQTAAGSHVTSIRSKSVTVKPQKTFSQATYVKKYSSVSF